MLRFTDMEYLYYFENASLTLRIFEYLYGKFQMPQAIVTVIYQMDGWLVRVKMYSTLNSQQDRDFRAYLNELGIPLEPPIRVNMDLWSLEAGVNCSSSPGRGGGPAEGWWRGVHVRSACP